MEEGTTTIEKDNNPALFCNLGLDEKEVLCCYQALRHYLRALASQENDTLGVMTLTLKVMQTLHPAAVAAAKAQSGQPQSQDLLDGPTSNNG